MRPDRRTRRDPAVSRHHDIDLMSQLANARGSAPSTSASPPVFANGCASDATIRIRTLDMISR